MLEVRYNKTTKKVTGWWGRISSQGNHEVKLKNRPNEAIIMLDIPVPNKELTAWLYDEATLSLVPNPAYSKPEPSRDLFAEIDELKARIDRLDNKL